MTKGGAVPAGRPGQPVPLRIVATTLHLMVFLVPLAISNLTWLGIGDYALTFDQFDMPKLFVLRALTLVGLGAWVWHMAAGGGRLRRSYLDWMVLAFLGWMVVATVFSIHVPTSLVGKYRRYDGLATAFTYAGVYFLALQSVDSLAKVRSLGRTLMASSVLVAAYGLAQYVGTTSSPGGP